MAQSRVPYTSLPSPADAARVPERCQVELEKPRYRYKNTLFKLGIVEAAMGSLSVLITMINLIIASQHRTYQCPYYYYDTDETCSYYHELTNTGAGIWCGAILLISGILGIKVRMHPSVCMYNANMTLSILAATFMLPFLMISAFAASTNVYSYEPEYRIYSLVAFHSILGVLAFVAGIICIVHSAYCCAGVCCRNKPYYFQPSGMQQAYQVVQLQNGQHAVLPQTSLPASQFPVAPPMYQPQVRVPVASSQFPIAPPPKYQPQPLQRVAVTPRAVVAPSTAAEACVALQPPRGGTVTPQTNACPEVADGIKQTEAPAELFSVQ